MHIGIDASSWANERGFGRFTRSLVRALAARESGMRYTLLFDQEPDTDIPPGTEARVAGARESLGEAFSTALSRSSGSLLRMGAAARRIDCDVFFFPAVYSYFPIFSGVPKVICYHDTIPERFPDLIFPNRAHFGLWKAKTMLAKWQATRIMTVSQASANDLEALLSIHPDRIDLVTEGASSEFFPIADTARIAGARAKCGVPDGAKLLVFLGGFSRHKNVIRLIEAMPQVLAAHPDAYLAIVGRTTGARFWDNIDELREGAKRDATASERIGFTGEIDDHTLAGLLNATEALVFPSLWEGFGLPAVEAMACHTPVIASDRGSLPEVVGEGGLLFDPTNTDAMAGHIIRLLGDASLRDRLKAAAAAQASRFSWEQAAEMAEISFKKAAGSKV